MSDTTTADSPGNQPLGLPLNDLLGLPAEAALSAHDLALRFDTSAAWLLNGTRPVGPLVGAGAYLEAATRLRRQAVEIERLKKVAEGARASVQKELHWYERYVLMKKGLKEPHEVYEAEAQRLFDLLESIDGIQGPNARLCGQ